MIKQQYQGPQQEPLLHCAESCISGAWGRRPLLLLLLLHISLPTQVGSLRCKWRQW
jgi:hypothetical protein